MIFKKDLRSNTRRSTAFTIWNVFK